MGRPIAEGRDVKFVFANGQTMIGRCIHMPADTGDCWYIQDKQGGEWGIQTFESVFIYPDTDSK